MSIIDKNREIKDKNYSFFVIDHQQIIQTNRHS